MPDSDTKSELWQSRWENGKMPTVIRPSLQSCALRLSRDLPVMKNLSVFLSLFLSDFALGMLVFNFW